MALFDVVFEGGGAKGSAFVGALDALIERGHQTRRLIGTSAGAITATLLAAGYSPAEMQAAVNEKVGGSRALPASWMPRAPPTSRTFRRTRARRWRRCVPRTSRSLPTVSC